MREKKNTLLQIKDIREKSQINQAILINLNQILYMSQIPYLSNIKYLGPYLWNLRHNYNNFLSSVPVVITLNFLLHVPSPFLAYMYKGHLKCLCNDLFLPGDIY